MHRLVEVLPFVGGFVSRLGTIECDFGLKGGGAVCGY